ncbi:MAG: lysophospholipid acyltransferase family protein [Myxococcota bacterium]
MIRKWPTFARLFRRMIAGHLREGLDGIYVRGWREARDRVAEGPVVLAPTHVSYWDTLLLMTIEDLLESDAYALMDDDNYQRLPFFGWIGAIPVDRAHARRALRTAVELLDRPGRMVIVFPQGRQRPAHLRPLDLQGGVATIGRMSGAMVQPLALTYVFHESPRPTVYLDFPDALEPGRDVRGFLSRLEASLIEGLERIDRGVEGETEFEPLVARSSLVRPGLGMRMLAWAARWGTRGD